MRFEGTSEAPEVQLSCSTEIFVARNILRELVKQGQKLPDELVAFIHEEEADITVHATRLFGGESCKTLVETIINKAHEELDPSREDRLGGYAKLMLKIGERHTPEGYAVQVANS